MLKLRETLLGGAALCLMCTPHSAAQEPATGAEREQVMIVLDASGSMWGQVEGRTKIDILRESYAALLDRWETAPVDAGLIVYGHRRKGDCKDIELVSRPGPVDAKAQKAFAGKLSPKGKTPLGASVRQAADILKSSEQKATVILLTDGAETCSVDPCALGRELEASGVDFTAHVIGFDIRSEKTRAELSCLASETGGKYLSAANAGELDLALEQASEPTPAIVKGPEIRALIDATKGTAGPTVWTVKGPDFELSTQTDMGRLDLSKTEGVTRTAGQIAVSASTLKGEYKGTASFDWPLSKPVEMTLSSVGSGAVVRVEGEAFSASKMRVTLSVEPGEDYALAIVPKGRSFPERVRIAYGDMIRMGSFDMRTAPEAGDYDLIYVFDPFGVKREDVRIPLEIKASDISLTAPQTVQAGQTFNVRWTGPALDDHMIVLGEAGNLSNRERVTWLSSGNTVTLQAPDTPGAYELRYEEDYTPLFIFPIEVK